MNTLLPQTQIKCTSAQIFDRGCVDPEYIKELLQSTVKEARDLYIYLTQKISEWLGSTQKAVNQRETQIKSGNTILYLLEWLKRQCTKCCQGCGTTGVSR